MKELLLRCALAAPLALMFVVGLSGRTPWAFFHSLLDHADPPVGAQFKAAPARLVLYFTGGVVQDSSWVQLKDAGDKGLPVTVSFDPSDVKVMYADVPPIGPGVYTVKWQTLSAEDDDYAQDSYKLTVLKADGSLPADAAKSSTGSSAPSSSAQSSGTKGNNGVVLLAIFLAIAVVVTGALGVAIRFKRSRL